MLTQTRIVLNQIRVTLTQVKRFWGRRRHEKKSRQWQSWQAFRADEARKKPPVLPLAAEGIPEPVKVSKGPEETTCRTLVPMARSMSREAGGR
jgi:hypothetical protein